MNTRYDTLDLNEKLIWNFRDIGHTIRHLYEGRGSQRRILILLNETGRVSQSQLTQMLGIQPGSASEVLAKLESAGWIVRTPSTADRRTTDVTLTAAGKTVAEEAKAQRHVRHEQMFACLPETEKKTLLALLEQINASWQAQYPRYNPAQCRRHGEKENSSCGNM